MDRFGEVRRKSPVDVLPWNLEAPARRCGNRSWRIRERLIAPTGIPRTMLRWKGEWRKASSMKDWAVFCAKILLVKLTPFVICSNAITSTPIAGDTAGWCLQRTSGDVPGSDTFEDWS